MHIWHHLDPLKIQSLSPNLADQLDLLHVMHQHTLDSINELSATDTEGKLTTLHQLKGHIPLLCTDEFTSKLLFEFKYLQTNHSSSPTFLTFLDTLTQLATEIHNHIHVLNHSRES